MSARRPRVLLMTPLPPPAGGMASWAARLLASRLSERFELRAIDTNPGPTAGLTPRKAVRYASWAASLLAELVRFRPDLVHVNSVSGMPHLLWEDAVYFTAIRRARAALVVHFHGTTMAGLLRNARHARVVKHVIRRADGLFALNRGEIEALRGAGAPDPLQVANFVGARPWREPTARSGPVRLLYVGWMIKEKGLFELFDALARVPDATLTLVGRFTKQGAGSSEADLRGAVERLGLVDRVTFVGEVPLSEIYAHFDAADVFLLPSYTEGFPTVLLEAMVSSLPAICTPVGAIPEVLVDGETGLLVPVRDADALAVAIARLVGDPAERRRMARAGWERVMANYEAEAVLAKIGDAWDAILARHRP